MSRFRRWIVRKLGEPDAELMLEWCKEMGWILLFPEPLYIPFCDEDEED